MRTAPMSPLVVGSRNTEKVSSEGAELVERLSPLHGLLMEAVPGGSYRFLPCTCCRTKHAEIKTNSVGGCYQLRYASAKATVQTSQHPQEGCLRKFAPLSSLSLLILSGSHPLQQWLVPDQSPTPFPGTWVVLPDPSEG